MALERYRGSGGQTAGSARREDHPLEYGGFEGTIPARQYGGGTVLLWDRESWIPRGDLSADYRDGHLKFDLAGDKLRGGWTPVRTHGTKYGRKSCANVY